ncbi:dTDP-4-dehydrorhamnose 3,5-epimerase family protein, partial [Escherichia coli]
MNVIKTKIEDLVIIEPKIYNDERGYFYEFYNKNKFTELGINLDFVQDNRSSSSQNVLRGLHFQKTKPQG